MSAMQPELMVLALAGLLQGVQFCLMSVAVNLDVGLAKTTSPRDSARLGKPLTEQLAVGPGRLYRAFVNHFEALILFIIAVMVVTLSAQSTPFTATCGWVYLGARLLYVPAYYFGLSPWRSLIWMIGFAATILMILAALV
jgi:uncharacterized MAPEG superfamily protein